MLKRLLYCIPLALLLGCANPGVTAYKTEGVVITSVDGAMNGWRDYANNPAADVKQAEIERVHSTYNQYVQAQLIAKAALEKWLASKSPDDAQALQTANAAVSIAKNALIDLVVSLIHKN